VPPSILVGADEVWSAAGPAGRRACRPWDASGVNAELAARAKGVQLDILKASTENEIDAAFASLVQQQAGALLIGSARRLTSAVRHSHSVRHYSREPGMRD
jgi:hypothetical protein